MKKSALLAVSALSLGLVGLSTFVPAVKAADAKSQTAVIKVTVNGTLGIGSKPQAQFDANGLDVTLNSLNAYDNTSKVSNAIYATNNSGASAQINIAGANSGEDKTSMIAKNGTDKIAAGTSIANGTSAWAYKGGLKKDWTAITAKGDKLADVPSQTADTKVEDLTYGVSTSANQPAGTYSATVQYTVTQ